MIMKRILTMTVIILMILPLKAQEFDLDTIMFNGPVDTCINFVILSDGYLESELDVFSAEADSMTTELFGLVPFRNYKDYFNVFSIRVPSNESGAAPHPDSLIDNYFGSTFNYAGIERLLVPTNNSRIISVLTGHFPAYDQVIMLVNTPRYGGSGGWVGTASTHPEVNELVFHELGHSFTGLADEYWAGEDYAAERINMTQQTDLEKLRWRNWYQDQGIGLYPHEESPTWYRPHQNCKMRYLGSPFCAVCMEGTVEKIHSLVSPLLSYDPAGTSFDAEDSLLQFSIRLLKPDPNTLKSSWKLNEKPLALNHDTVAIPRDSLVPGINSLTVTIEDTTSLLRVDDHEIFHLYTVSWSVRHSVTGQDEILGSADQAIIEIYPNPTPGRVHIRLTSGSGDELQIEVFDMHGAKIYTLSPDGQNHVSLDLQKFPRGTYLIRFIRDGSPVATKRIVRI